MPPTTDLDDVVTSITDSFVALGPVVPSVVGAAIGIALLFWGAPKLVGLFKRIAK